MTRIQVLQEARAEWVEKLNAAKETISDIYAREQNAIKDVLFPFFEDFSEGVIVEVQRGSVYFKMFDDLIKSPILQGSKICIVHDTFDEDYKHWFEKYPKNLVTSRQLFSKESFSDPILKNQQDDSKNFYPFCHYSLC